MKRLVGFYCIWKAGLEQTAWRPFVALVRHEGQVAQLHEDVRDGTGEGSWWVDRPIDCGFLEWSSSSCRQAPGSPLMPPIRPAPIKTLGHRARTLTPRADTAPHCRTFCTVAPSLTGAIGGR